MSSSALDTRATDVSVTPEYLTVALHDGRRISAPLEWFPRLLNATDEQRKDWQFIGSGSGIHWQQVDEDISVNLLLGLPC
ncbi:DUF2442 domain-containing protein [Humibacter antri]